MNSSLQQMLSICQCNRLISTCLNKIYTFNINTLCTYFNDKKRGTLFFFFCLRNLISTLIKSAKKNVTKIISKLFFFKNWKIYIYLSVKLLYVCEMSTSCNLEYIFFFNLQFVSSQFNNVFFFAVGFTNLLPKFKQQHFSSTIVRKRNV